MSLRPVSGPGQLALVSGLQFAEGLTDRQAADAVRRRISIAAMCCYLLCQKSRLICRPRIHSLLKGARKSFAWQDYRDLLIRAHLRLGAPIVVVWDNLNTHRTAGLRAYAAGHDCSRSPNFSPIAPK